jgi:CRP-like cAMP-binding protein
MSAPEPQAARNRLLAALPPDVLAQIRPKLTCVSLTNRQVLYPAEGPIEAVYFPEAGMVSMVSNLEDGVQAEVGIVGREGMAGVPLLCGVDTSFVEALVQMPGQALRMEAGAFRRELEANATLRALLFRYNEALHAQISQTAACNGRHGLEQRLARWLLMAHDRVDGDELPLTQDFIATMLGVPRPRITLTARILQWIELIHYARQRTDHCARPRQPQATSCERHEWCHGAAALYGLTGPKTSEDVRKRTARLGRPR